MIETSALSSNVATDQWHDFLATLRTNRMTRVETVYPSESVYELLDLYEGTADAFERSRRANYTAARQSNRRIQELLEANNRYLERARVAERQLAGFTRDFSNVTFATMQTTSVAPLTATHLAEALGCFWNAAIGEAHNKQDSTAFAVIGSMAEGVAAIERQLREISPPSDDFTELREDYLRLQKLVVDQANSIEELKTSQQTEAAPVAWTEEKLREEAKRRGWYVRESASVPDLKTGGWKHPFSVTASSRELLEFFASSAVTAGEPVAIKALGGSWNKEHDALGRLIKLLDEEPFIGDAEMADALEIARCAWDHSKVSALVHPAPVPAPGVAEALRDVLIGITEYWNGAPESAVDAIETVIDRAHAALAALRSPEGN
ncbi:hypothetical protein [Mesorhizobium sp. ANAO-SY3R2]|uniref:hypothetical protein n=1 Tax=Mesorhizobium sp. ANAO-SY3R2 TaxID=3166644 RepID=UPI00366E92FC